MKLKKIIVVISLVLFIGLVANGEDSFVLNSPVEIAPNTLDKRTQLFPEVAFDGDKTFMVVWQQGRKFFESSDPQLFAARVSIEGKILDSTPIEVCNAKGAKEMPRIIFSKGVFLIVWQDFRNGKNWDIYATRLNSVGKVLDLDGIVISNAPNSQGLPVLANAPDGFLVIWQDFRNAQFYKPYATFVSSEGKVNDPNGVELKFKEKSLDGGNLELINTNDSWRLIFNDPRGGGQAYYKSVRIDEKLNILDVTSLPCQLMGRSGVRLASDGQKSLLICSFSAGHGGGCNPVVASLFDVSNAIALKNPNEERKGVGAGTSGYNTERMIVLREPERGGQGKVSAAFDGKKYLIAFRGLGREKPFIEGNQIFIARLTPEGKRLDDTDRQALVHEGPLPGSNPSVASSKEDKFLVVYEVDNGEGLSRIWTRVVVVK